MLPLLAQLVLHTVNDLPCKSRDGFQSIADYKNLPTSVYGAFFYYYTCCPISSVPALLLHLLPKTNSNKAKVTIDT